MSGAEGAPAVGAVTLHRSASARARLAVAHRFVESLPAASEAFVVGASRDAVDDFVRDSAARRGAAFGLHRFSLRRLATRIAAPRLAARGLAPATRLGAEAVAARAAFELLQPLTDPATPADPVAARAAFEAARPAADEAERGALGYLAPIAKLRSFGRTLASTLEDVRAGGVEAEALSACDPVGADLDALSREYARQLDEARLIDLPELYRLAAAVVEAREPVDVPLGVPVVLLDAPVHDRAALGLVAALAGRATRLLATVPRGDDRTWAALSGLPHAEAAAPARDAAAPDTPLARVRTRLFEPIAAPEAENARPAGDEVSLFSAPGESRECVEIARLVQKEAARGVPLDRMAVVLRSPQVYSGLLETALRRAGVEAWFVRGTRAPDPAGRAFLACWRARPSSSPRADSRSTCRWGRCPSPIRRVRPRSIARDGCRRPRPIRRCRDPPCRCRARCSTSPTSIRSMTTPTRALRPTPTTGRSSGARCALPGTGTGCSSSRPSSAAATGGPAAWQGSSRSCASASRSAPPTTPVRLGRSGSNATSAISGTCAASRCR